MYAMDYKAVLPEDWKWPNFKPEEFRCRESDTIIVVSEFMSRLQDLRYFLGFPLVLTSGYRSPKYNARISSTGEDGPHTTGRAVDINIWGGRAFRLISHAAEFGFTGIGSMQKGSWSKRFVHLDDLETIGDRVRPNTWTY